VIFNEVIQDINKAIELYLDSLKGIPEPLFSAMKYSVTIGGKRIRPLLVILGASTGDYNKEDILKFAIAVELIHTYSLIHDDLPSMDNDTLRRGKPTAHIVYGEGMALLSGDALLNQAYEILTEVSSENINYAKASNYIAKQAGSIGMIAGQCIDISNEVVSVNDLVKMYSLKTSSLLKAALAGGAIAAGADENTVNRLEQFAECLGISFQIADDILDVFGDEKNLGKNIGSDENNKKPTIIKLIGLKKAQELKDFYENKALEVINTLNVKDNLITLIDLLKNRIK